MGNKPNSTRNTPVTNSLSVANGYKDFTASAKTNSNQRARTTATSRGGGALGRHQIQDAYEDSPIVRQVVDFPGFAALAKWRTWQGDEKQNTAIENAERALDVKGKMIRAYNLARKDGGCALLIVTDEPDYSVPLDPRRIKRGGIQSLDVLEREKFTKIDINVSPGTIGYGEASMFHLSLVAGRGALQQNTITKIHPSRLVIFKGEPRSRAFAGQGIDDYWGDSVLRSLLPGIQALEAVYGNTDAMTHLARIPVLNVGDGLNSSALSPEHKKANDAMLQHFIDAQDILALSVVGTDMEYKVHNYNFAGIPPIIEKFEIRVAAEANIPVSILFEKPRTGLGTSGVSDLLIWHERLVADHLNKQVNRHYCNTEP